jgi:V8-like Glu-specific endopeptidase
VTAGYVAATGPDEKTPLGGFMTAQTSGPIAESVIGPDNRVLVGNTTIYPFSAVVRVDIDFDGDGFFEAFGSGAMIGPNDVLTAGHNLWDPAFGFARNIRVTPGQAGSSTPFGAAFGTVWTVPSEYVSTGGSFEFDIGVINLGSNIGNSTGWFGLQSVSAATATDSIVQLAGYPGDLSGGDFQYTSSDNVDFVSGNQLFYDGALDTFGGNSGGPLWWNLSGGPFIVGVHTSGGSLFNGGTMLTSDFFARVTAWANDGGGSPIAGTGANDSLTGTDAGDQINGLGGNDSINAGNGFDTINGNQGNDSVFV